MQFAYKLAIIYFSIFSRKCNHFFTIFQNFFPDPTATDRQNSQGFCQQPKQPPERQAPGPKIGAQAAENGQLREKPQPSPAGIEGEAQQGRQRQQAVDQIRQPGGPPTPAQGPQQIIAQAQAGPHRQGIQQLPELREHRQLHQPRIRRSRPFDGACS